MKLTMMLLVMMIEDEDAGHLRISTKAEFDDDDDDDTLFRTVH